MKKKIIVISHGLEIGGAERALLGLLYSFDYMRYDVDLFLMHHQGELMEYTEREQLLLDLLEQNDRLSLNRYCRLARLSRRAAEHLLAKLIRYDIVEPVFEGHKFHFKLK